jgi:hypothetical protein
MATKSRADFTKQIKEHLQDGAEVLAPPNVDSLIDRALEVFKKKKPGNIVVELTSDGNGKFNVADLTGYDEEISGDPQIEFPVIEDGEPEYLDRRDWQFRRTPDGLVIQVFAGIGNGEKVRFHFKGDHSITATGSTIPASDFHAFCKLAAAEGFDDMSNYYTQTSDGQAADNVSFAQFGPKTDKYALRAKELRKQANEHFGIKGDSSVGAASVTKNWDTKSSQGGDRLTHRRRLR